VVRGHNDLIGTPCVFANQSGIVAANFTARPVGVVEEIDVVNGDHLRRAPRWRQQRMRGADDILVAGSEPFDWRPFEIVPGQVEEPNRNPMIRHAGSRAFALKTGIGSILPRTCKQRERVAKLPLSQMPRELMQVFADPGPRSKRRPIV
jgi:hypothetical protein